MAIPDYQTLMFPLLKIAADGREHRFRDGIETLAAQFGVTGADRAELLPSGSQPILDNRVGWARTYMKKAGLLDSPRRGFIQITTRGRDVLKENPKRVDVKFLEQFPEFVEFRALRHETSSPAPNAETTPEEALEEATSGYA